MKSILAIVTIILDSGNQFIIGILKSLVRLVHRPIHYSFIRDSIDQKLHFLKCYKERELSNIQLGSCPEILV